MSDFAWLLPAFLTIITASTPLVYAAVGELVVEKSGVLNLGVEGMMIMGAVLGFGITIVTGSVTLGIVAGAMGGAVTSAIFGYLTLYLLSNQVATGLALTLFGIGLSSLIGIPFVGKSLDRLQQLNIPYLTDIPVIGPVLFGQDALVYLSIVSVVGVTWFLNKTRAGLILRAVGENHDAAHSIGHPVVLVRFAAVLFGGAMAGIGGAYLSIAITPLWVENMVAGRGWIALALVVFSAWRPGRALLGAYLFGGITIIQLHAQGFGIDIPSQFLSMLPYAATIIVLIVISRDAVRARLNAPACLGKIFHATA
jgi:general nucleoside transport system permease protein